MLSRLVDVIFDVKNYEGPYEMMFNLLIKPEVLYELDNNSLNRLRIKDFLIILEFFKEFLLRENFKQSL
jgi:hypothetical protein